MPEKKQTQKFIFRDLSKGMDQSTNPSLTTGSPHLKNVTLERKGVYASRLGSDLLFATMGANPGYGLWDYNLTDGTHKFFAVTDRDLFVLNESTGWGSAIDTDEWTANKKVDGIDFLNRSYIGCEDGTTALAYTTGSTITDVTPTIGGPIMAVNKSILAVAGNNIKPSVIFFTDPFTDTFYSATGTCAANADIAGANTVTATTSIFEPDMEGAMLYNTTLGEMNLITDWTSGTVVTTDAATATWNDDTIYVLQNCYKAIKGNCTGMTAYRDKFVSFDENSMYTWDPTVGESGFSKEIPGQGCVNYRTVKVVNGLLIWVNRRGVWLYNGEGLPQDITENIRDKIDGYGLFDLINNTWSTLSAGVLESEGKYLLSVGTLATKSGAPATATADAVFVFDTKKGAWTLESYQDTYLAFSTFVNSTGVKNLYAIGSDDAAVSKLQTGATDDDSSGTATAYTSEIRTPHHRLFKDSSRMCTIDEYYVKYTSAGEVSVYTAVDRTYDATAAATLPAATTPVTYSIGPQANKEGFTHGLRFTSTGKYQIEEYGFKATLGTTNRLPRL